MLYYTKALTATSLWKMPVEGGQATKVLDGLSSYLNVALGGNGLYFVPEENEPATSSIQFLDFGTGQIKPVANLEKRLKLNASSAGLAVSPDGRWILCSQVEQSGSELLLVENFH